MSLVISYHDLIKIETENKIIIISVQKCALLAIKVIIYIMNNLKGERLLFSWMTSRYHSYPEIKFQLSTLNVYILNTILK